MMTESAFRSTLEDILGVARGSLRDSDSRDTIGSWSSLADVHILTIISNEFGIEPNSDLLEAETVGDLIRVLDEQSVFAA